MGDPIDATPAAGTPALQRSLKARHVEMIAIGGIIGAGLFVGSSAAIASVGPAIVLSYLAAGLIVLCVMRMLSEMATAFPGIQSFPEFARLGLGDWAGFMSGWLYWYFWVVVVAIEAIAGATIIDTWLPMIGIPTISIALLVGLTGVNLLSTKSYGESEFVLSSIKVAAIIAFLLLACGYLFGIGNSDGASVANLTAHGGFMPRGGVAVLAGTTTVIFALVGAEIATIAAAEAAEPARTVARMTSTVAIRILVFYVLSILVIVAIVPWTDIRPGVSPFAVALARIGLPGGEAIMNAVVLVAVLSCLNSGIYVTSRVLFALAHRGEAPAIAGRTGRKSVPRPAILIGAFVSLLVLFAGIYSPERGFSFLVNASGAIMLVLYALIALAQLRLRARSAAQGLDAPAIRMWLHPWGSIGTILAIIGVLAAMATTDELVSQFVASLVAVTIVIIAFIVRHMYRTTPSSAPRVFERAP